MWNLPEPRIKPLVPCTGRRVFNYWTTGKPLINIFLINLYNIKNKMKNKYIKIPFLVLSGLYIIFIPSFRPPVAKMVSRGHTCKVIPGSWFSFSAQLYKDLPPILSFHLSQQTLIGRMVQRSFQKLASQSWWDKMFLVFVCPINNISLASVYKPRYLCGSSGIQHHMPSGSGEVFPTVHQVICIQTLILATGPCSDLWSSSGFSWLRPRSPRKALS